DPRHRLTRLLWWGDESRAARERLHPHEGAPRAQPCTRRVQDAPAPAMARRVLPRQSRSNRRGVTNTTLTDALLLDLRPRIEAISGCRLVPTYSYARVYFHGDTFIRHCDRGSCEVSVSIQVGRDGGEASLWFRPNTKVGMEEGDGVVYLGCETDHWRERFGG